MKVILLLCGLSLTMYAISLEKRFLMVTVSRAIRQTLQIRRQRLCDTNVMCVANKRGFYNVYGNGWKNDAKTALMPEAVSQYGLMPELGFDNETLKEIGNFYTNRSLIIPNLTNLSMR